MTKSSKKPKSAVGLKYDQGDGTKTPKVIAKGFGELAEEIINIAKQNGVLIHEDAYLTDFLATLDLGQEIPEQLYHVIAELIAFSYVLQGKFPESWTESHKKISTKT